MPVILSPSPERVLTNMAVIVPALNEESRIDKCIVSIQRQLPPPSTVVVVANGCNDRTAERAKKHGVTVVETEKPGVSRARNLGAAVCTEQVLLFLDADSCLDEGVLAAVSRAVSAGAIGGSCGARPLEANKRARMFWRFYNRWSRFMLKTNGMMFYQREAFELMEGYNEVLKSGEDSDLHRKIRQLGPVVHLDGVFIGTSQRRFTKRGYLRTLLEWEASFLFPRKGDYEEIRP
jgi:glycosyltransferase involved in cell wall biosynthesis